MSANILSNFLRSTARLSRPVGFLNAFSTGTAHLNRKPQVSGIFSKLYIKLLWKHAITVPLVKVDLNNMMFFACPSMAVNKFHFINTNQKAKNYVLIIIGIT